MSGMVEARNVKFGVQIHHESINEKNKIMLRGREEVAWPTFEILAPSISLERSNNNTAVDRAILSKFGFERDLNIAKRVLLLNPTLGLDFQLHMAAIF